jgi:hypothetical protein
MDSSDHAGGGDGISDWVSLKKPAADPKSHTPVSNSYY